MPAKGCGVRDKEPGVSVLVSPYVREGERVSAHRLSSAVRADGGEGTPASCSADHGRTEEAQRRAGMPSGQVSGAQAKIGDLYGLELLNSSAVPRDVG